MKRKNDPYLLELKESKNRKILLLRGARQVGKTYSIRRLGSHFKNFLEINFEEDKEVHAFFKGSLNPFEIIQKLIGYSGQSIKAGQTLLFFDEIQACPDALRSLRFFYEKIPDLHVAAAGSLIEFALSEIPSFGVGRISSMFMYPVTFSEFLSAIDEDNLNSAIDVSGFNSPVEPVLHNKILDRFKTYLLIGGMPAVVEIFRTQRDLVQCQTVIDDLTYSIRDDFAKYKRRSPVSKLKEIFSSIPHQTGNKFKYSAIAQNSTSQGYKEALDLLVDAGLAYKVFHTAARGIPLGAQINEKRFKSLIMDLGMHQRIIGLDMAGHLLKGPVSLINKGSLAELFTGLELIAGSLPSARSQLYYWHREARGSNAEIDYVCQVEDQIVPLEVKAGTKGQMQSMHMFLKDRSLKRGVRLSQENFSRYGEILTVPIYAVRRIHELLHRAG